MSILCLDQATIFIIFFDRRTHIWCRKHIMDILYENVGNIW